MEACRARGLDFLAPPNTYYETLQERLKTAKIKIIENMELVSWNVGHTMAEQASYVLSHFSSVKEERHFGGLR